MKLNIHILSHPIIQYLYSINRQTYLANSLQQHIQRQLGTFLIYESIRNWIQTHQLIIKQITTYKEIILLDKHESYLLITNHFKSLSLVQEIEYILPKCSINLITIEDLHNIKLNESMQNIECHHKVIIVTYNLSSKYIIQLINTILNISPIKINQIRITCIKCHSEQLIKISNKYPELNIYTTNINQNML